MSILQAIEAEQRLRNLIAWSDLGNTIAKYEGKHHSLRVDIQLNNVMYCGQQYAGAPNYHDAPKWLFDKIIAELQTGVGEAVRRVVEAEKQRLLKEMTAGLAEAQQLADALSAHRKANP